MQRCMSAKNMERRSQKTEETIKKEEICKMMKNKKTKKKTKVGLRVRPAMLVALKINQKRSKRK